MALLPLTPLKYFSGHTFLQLALRVLLLVPYAIKRLASGVFRNAFKLIFNSHQLIVFANTVGAAHGTGFDLSGLKADNEVGD